MARPTILVVGARGQLGFELARLLPAHGEVTALDRSELDIGDPDAIRETLRALRPVLAVNAAAYTSTMTSSRSRR